jgi:hypothetical protein
VKLLPTDTYLWSDIHFLTHFRMLSIHLRPWNSSSSATIGPIRIPIQDWTCGKNYISEGGRPSPDLMHTLLLRCRLPPSDGPPCVASRRCHRLPRRRHLEHLRAEVPNRKRCLGSPRGLAVEAGRPPPAPGGERGSSRRRGNGGHKICKLDPHFDRNYSPRSINLHTNP